MNILYQILAILVIKPNNIIMGTYLIHPNTEINTQTDSSVSTKLKYSFCEIQGWRRQMQDATICESDLGDGNSLFAVFDGHGGNEVAKYAEKVFVEILLKQKKYQQANYGDAISDAFKEIDDLIDSQIGEKQMMKIKRQYKKKWEKKSQQKISEVAGCTANVVLITPTSYIIANIGDSRSVLVRANQKTVVLSTDHKPQVPTEYKRIIRAGGQIICGRVNGGLNLTRCLGDFMYKQSNKLPYDQQLIICKPQIREFARVKGDEFILIGCDGIWEKYTDNSYELAMKIKKERDSGKEGVQILRQMVRGMVAHDLNEETGCDNMTAIMIQFL